MSTSTNKQNITPMRANLFDGIISTIRAESLDDSAMVRIDDTTSIIKKDYTFAIPKGKRGTVSINDSDIILSVDRINAARTGQDMFGYVIAREMARISEKEDTIKKMGFDDIADFGAAMFGYKRVTVNQYVRIGKYLVTDEYKPIQVLPTTISMSAMIEMLAPASDENGVVDVAKIASWYAGGLLTDGMSKAKIRAALKGADSPALPEKSDDSKGDKAIENSPNELGTSSVTTDSGSTYTLGSPDASSVIDRLNSMTPDMATGYALNALEMVEALFSKFDNSEFATEHINALRTAARKWIG